MRLLTYSVEDPEGKAAIVLEGGLVHEDLRDGSDLPCLSITCMIS